MVDSEKTEVLWKFALHAQVLCSPWADVSLKCIRILDVGMNKAFDTGTIWEAISGSALLSERSVAYREAWQSHLHWKVPSRWRNYFGRTALMEAMNRVQRFGAAQPMLSYVCVSLQFPRLCTSLFSPGPEAKLLKCEEESNSHGVSSSNRIRRERGNLMRKLLRFPVQAHSGPWSSSSISSKPLSPHFWVHGSPIAPEWQRFWCAEASSNPMELYYAPAWR